MRADGRFRLDRPIFVPDDCSLEGGYKYAPAHVGSAITFNPMDPTRYHSISNHSVLLGYYGRGQADGSALVSVGSNAALLGVVIFYPEQSPFAEPTAYPFAIDLCSEAQRRTQQTPSKAGPGYNATPAYTSIACTNPAVMDVELVNAYQGVRAVFAPRYLIARVMGQPLLTGILSSRIFDIGRIEDVHFYSYWASTDVVLSFQRTHGCGFAFGRNDWAMVRNTFAWAYARAYRFYADPDLPHATGDAHGWVGGCTSGQMAGITADFAVHAVHGECFQNEGVQITHAEFTAFENADHAGGDIDTVPAAVYTEQTTTGVLRISNSAMFGPGAIGALRPGRHTVTPSQHSVVRLQGRDEQVYLEGVHLMQWNNSNDGPGSASDTPLVDVAGSGQYSLTASSLMATHPATAVRIGADVNSAVVMGNTLCAGRGVVNEAVVGSAAPAAITPEGSTVTAAITSSSAASRTYDHVSIGLNVVPRRPPRPLERDHKGKMRWSLWRTESETRFGVRHAE